MLFSVMTKNLKWEISTENLVTSKRWDGVNDEKFIIILILLKNLILFFWGRGAWKINFFWRGRMVNLLKRSTWIVCEIKRGPGKKEKKKGWCFWGWEVGRSWDPNAQYELEEPSYWHKYPKQITLEHRIITNNINYNWHIVSTYLKKNKTDY